MNVKEAKRSSRICFLLALLLILQCIFITLSAAGEAETLTVGSKGDRVTEVKQRLQKLGYLEQGSITKKYNDKTAQAIREFQRLNGLPETGDVDAETAERLFSDQAIRKPRPTLEPLMTPAPIMETGWPERDSEGFLMGDGEYFSEDDEAGQWVYLNRNLQIFIRRGKESSIPLEWFETEILTRDGETFRTAITDPEIISETTNSRTGHHLPNLDMMAQYPDGRFEVYECTEYTAQQLLEKGAVNVFSFGPILLRDGEINELLYTYYRSIEPRHALGMIEPNHYLLLSVQGRNKDSKGTMLQRVAEMMKERGVTQALNLDGGNTMALIFRGRMLNKLATYKRRNFVRTVTSLIGIGYTEQQAE